MKLVSLQTVKALRHAQSVVQANMWTQWATTRRQTALTVWWEGMSTQLAAMRLWTALHAMLVDMELAEVQPVSAQVIVQLASILLGQLQQGRRLPTASTVWWESMSTQLATMRLWTALHVMLAAMGPHAERQVSVQGHVQLADFPQHQLQLDLVLLIASHAIQACILMMLVVAVCRAASTVLRVDMSISLAATRPPTAFHVILVDTESWDPCQVNARETVQLAAIPPHRLLLVPLRLSALHAMLEDMGLAGVLQGSAQVTVPSARILPYRLQLGRRQRTALRAMPVTMQA